MKKIFWFIGLGFTIFALTGCGAEKTPDPIQSLSKATENTEHLVMFEATKAVWVQYNVSPMDEASVPVTVIQPTAAAPIADPAGSDTVPFGELDTTGKDAVSEPAPTAEIGLPSESGSANPGFYTLQAGETPNCIARRYDLNYIQLYSINGINFKNEALIGEGKNLILPQKSSWQTESHGPRAILPHPAEHAVVAGETLYTIACAYGDVTPEAIAVENGLTSPDQLVPGMLLKIP